jgi:hypothetical protein
VSAARTYCGLTVTMRRTPAPCNALL